MIWPTPINSGGYEIVETTNACSILSKIIVVEIVLLIIGGLFVSNMHPVWMQVSVPLLGLLLLATFVIWFNGCKSRT